ncbi:MAG: putative membrane-associated protein [Parcubacteria group bacterium Greene0714_7]|nr:MAG: putative membrane-associated protein [Parcubacteria group bacterium Greene0714_7]
MLPDLSSLIQTFGYIGIVAVVFAESGLFFGFFLPGDSLLFTAGFLASQGFLNIFILIALTTTAAITGDSVGYWFGKKVGPFIFSRPDSFWFSHKRVEDASAFFAKHGPKSLVLARFIPAVRTFTPILAGVGQMNYRTFLTYNVIGGVLWGTGLPILGYFLGRLVPHPDRYIIPIVLIIVVISMLPILREIFRKKKSIS